MGVTYNYFTLLLKFDQIGNIDSLVNECENLDIDIYVNEFDETAKLTVEEGEAMKIYLLGMLHGKRLKDRE